MTSQTKDAIQFGLLGIIAITVIYGTFIKEDPIPPRNSSSQQQASNNPSQPANVTDNANPLQPSPDMQQQMNQQQQQQPQQPKKPSGPPTSVKWEDMAHDFGQIKQDTENEKIFSFTNTGDNPLIIESAKGSCGCTVPEYPREPIPPGQSGEIKVVYKPGKQKGRQTKTVTINANTNPPQTTLNISANVEEVDGNGDA